MDYINLAAHNLKTDGIDYGKTYPIISCYDTNINTSDIYDMLSKILKGKILRIDKNNNISDSNGYSYSAEAFMFVTDDEKVILRNDGLIYISAINEERVRYIVGIIHMAAKMDVNI